MSQELFARIVVSIAKRFSVKSAKGLFKKQYQLHFLFEKYLSFDFLPLPKKFKLNSSFHHIGFMKDTAEIVDATRSQYLGLGRVGLGWVRTPLKRRRLRPKTDFENEGILRKRRPFRKRKTCSKTKPLEIQITTAGYFNRFNLLRQPFQ